MAQPSSIVCKECSHVNEAQRVYCHNCGVKLDRSAIAQEQKKGNESSEQKLKRVRKLMRPGGGLLSKATLGSAVRAVFWGAVVGLAITLVRPPEGVPPEPEAKLPEGPPLGHYLSEQSTPTIRRVLAFKEAEINEYLRSVLRPKTKEEGGGLPVKFQRAFVNLGDGQLRLTSQSAVFDYPLYTGVVLAAKSENGNLVVRPVQLQLGRLAIPEFITQHLSKPIEVIFSSLKDALKKERTDLAAVGALEIRKDAVYIATPGMTIPPAAAQP